MRKKMSELDRAEALLRIPQYKKDLERLTQFQEKWRKQEEAFRKKYVIPIEDEIDGKKIVFDTIKTVHSKKIANLNETNLHQYLKKEKAVCKKYALVTLVTPALVESLRNPKVTAIHKKTGRLIPQEMLNKKAPDIIKREKTRRIKAAALFRREKNIVNIPVDLNLPEEKSKFLALKDIELRYQARKNLSEKSKNRNRDFSYYPWEIYDMQHKRGLTLIEIAKEKSGINDYPSNNPKVNAAYQCAKRALEYAENN